MLLVMQQNMEVVAQEGHALRSLRDVLADTKSFQATRVVSHLHTGMEVEQIAVSRARLTQTARLHVIGIW